MLSHRRFPVAVVCSLGLLIFAWVAVGWGQFPAGQGMRRTVQKHAPAEAPRMEASGTIDAIGPGLIRIKTPLGEPLLFQATRETKVHVTGTAKKDVLKPGSFICFTAEVNKQQSQAQGPVERLILLTPSQERPPGVFPDQAGLDLEAEGNAFGADAPGDKPRAKRKPARGKDTSPPIERFEIVGQIRGISKEGKLTVFVPNRYFKPPLEIELTEAPEIELDLTLTWANAFRLATKGDQVEARGRQVGPAAAQATELTIQLAEPWTTVHPKKTLPHRTPRSRRARSDEAKQEAVEQTEEQAPKEAEETVKAKKKAKEAEPDNP